MKTAMRAAQHSTAPSLASVAVSSETRAAGAGMRVPRMCCPTGLMEPAAAVAWSRTRSAHPSGPALPEPNCGLGIIRQEPCLDTIVCAIASQTTSWLLTQIKASLIEFSFVSRSTNKARNHS